MYNVVITECKAVAMCTLQASDSDSITIHMQYILRFIILLSWIGGNDVVQFFVEAKRIMMVQIMIRTVVRFPLCFNLNGFPLSALSFNHFFCFMLSFVSETLCTLCVFLLLILNLGRSFSVHCCLRYDASFEISISILRNWIRHL